MFPLSRKIEYLKALYQHYSSIAKHHSTRCTQLRDRNHEQAEAHWERNLFWLAKAERIYGKLGELTERMDRFIQSKYGSSRRRNKHG